MHNRQPQSENLRKGRHSQPGFYYFLTTCVANRRPIFRSRHRAAIVLDAIRWSNTESRFFVAAAVVMPDHLHFAGQLGDSTLARVMHTLKSFSATHLAKTGIETPVWQNGYHDHVLRDDEDYNTRLRYLIENPMRAGLVERGERYPYLITPDWWVDH